MTTKTHTVTLKVANTGDFATFGHTVIAYVKKMDIDGQEAYAIFGANGEKIGAEPSENLAMITAQHMNLFPVVVQ